MPSTYRTAKKRLWPFRRRVSNLILRIRECQEIFNQNGQLGLLYFHLALYYSKASEIIAKEFNEKLSYLCSSLNLTANEKAQLSVRATNLFFATLKIQERLAKEKNQHVECTQCTTDAKFVMTFLRSWGFLRRNKTRTRNQKSDSQDEKLPKMVDIQKSPMALQKSSPGFRPGLGRVSRRPPPIKCPAVKPVCSRASTAPRQPISDAGLPHRQQRVRCVTPSRTRHCTHPRWRFHRWRIKEFLKTQSSANYHGQGIFVCS